MSASKALRRQSLAEIVALCSSVKKKLAGSADSSSPANNNAQTSRRLAVLESLDELTDQDFESCFGMTKEAFEMRVDLASPIIESKKKSTLSPTDSQQRISEAETTNHREEPDDLSEQIRSLRQENVDLKLQFEKFHMKIQDNVQEPEEVQSTPIRNESSNLDDAVWLTEEFMEQFPRELHQLEDQLSRLTGSTLSNVDDYNLSRNISLDISVPNIARVSSPTSPTSPMIGVDGPEDSRLVSWMEFYDGSVNGSNMTPTPSTVTPIPTPMRAFVENVSREGAFEPSKTPEMPRTLESELHTNGRGLRKVGFAAIDEQPDAVHMEEMEKLKSKLWEMENLAEQQQLEVRDLECLLADRDHYWQSRLSMCTEEYSSFLKIHTQKLNELEENTVRDLCDHLVTRVEAAEQLELLRAEMRELESSHTAFIESQQASLEGTKTSLKKERRQNKKIRTEYETLAEALRSQLECVCKERDALFESSGSRSSEKDILVESLRREIAACRENLMLVENLLLAVLSGVDSKPSAESIQTTVDVMSVFLRQHVSAALNQWTAERLYWNSELNSEREAVEHWKQRYCSILRQHEALQQTLESVEKQLEVHCQLISDTKGETEGHKEELRQRMVDILKISTVESNMAIEKLGTLNWPDMVRWALDLFGEVVEKLQFDVDSLESDNVRLLDQLKNFRVREEVHNATNVALTLEIVNLKKEIERMKEKAVPEVRPERSSKMEDPVPSSSFHPQNPAKTVRKLFAFSGLTSKSKGSARPTEESLQEGQQPCNGVHQSSSAKATLENVVEKKKSTFYEKMFSSRKKTANGHESMNVSPRDEFDGIVSESNDNTESKSCNMLGVEVADDNCQSTAEENENRDLKSSIGTLAEDMEEFSRSARLAAARFQASRAAELQELMGRLNDKESVITELEAKLRSLEDETRDKSHRSSPDAKLNATVNWKSGYYLRQVNLKWSQLRGFDYILICFLICYYFVLYILVSLFLTMSHMLPQETKEHCE